LKKIAAQSVKKALLIFAKNPVLGKVKTRLAVSIGNEKALMIYKNLLFYTFDVAQNTDSFVFACFDEKDDFTLSSIEFDAFYKQQNGDLGHKMYQAFDHAFAKGFEQVVVIGTDCLDLTGELIQQAHQKLANSDFVIGPAKDGGYYLLGMKKNNKNIFKNIDWSSEKVLEQTLEKIKTQNLTVALLKTLSDIDTLEDLQNSELRNLI
jgi:uncharacterized protein